MIKAGELRPLALTCAEPMASIPGVPGAREAGMPDMNIRTWWSVHAPAKTPKAICDRLETEFRAIAVAPETVAFLADNGADPMPGDAASLRDLLASEVKAWAGYAKLAHIEPV